MDTKLLITIIVAGLLLLVTILGWVSAICSGEMKKFIMEKMEEAETSGKTGTEKLQYVIDAFKEKYKVMSFIVDVKKFVELLIEFSKKVNAKK